uniref:Glycosyltransferase 6 domain containing 1 n=1 Tax=Otolemur garnettii TaxID=30611 RepID=H0XHS5_OTOGA
RTRPDVITITDWLAPIIWEGTYNRSTLEKHYKKLNVTIGLAVFATGKFVDQYLTQFIQSAERHFMIGYHTIFYIMVDNFTKLPYIEFGPLRTYHNFDQDFHLKNMMNLKMNILGYIQHEVNFLFTMAVNQIFKKDFGVETLGSSVAQIHAWWYFKSPRDFPYERRHKSAAFIPSGQGDFYYHGAIVGGIPREVLNVIKECQKGIIQDNTNDLKSLYESHLNKYFFVNKPTKLLSPEYNWDPKFRTPSQIKHVKIAWQSERKR